MVRGRDKFSYKFVQKLWNLNSIIIDEIKNNHFNDCDNKIDVYANKFIKKNKINLNNFNYNIVIANLHEMYSFMFKNINNGYKSNTLSVNYEKILICLMPIIPHFASECLEMINKKSKINWPIFDENLTKEMEINIVIQINGKKRGLIKGEPDMNEEKVFELVKKEKNIQKYLENKNINKKIYVKNRLINIIISE